MGLLSPDYVSLPRLRIKSTVFTMIHTALPDFSPPLLHLCPDLLLLSTFIPLDVPQGHQAPSCFRAFDVAVLFAWNVLRNPHSSLPHLLPTSPQISPLRGAFLTLLSKIAAPATLCVLSLLYFNSHLVIGP